MSVAGLIAAAGLSTRMGRPKALLPVGASGIPFVWHLAVAFVDAGVAPLVITVPDGAVGDAIRATVAPLSINPAARLLVVPNDEPNLGFSGSVRTALARAGTSTALLLTPVDAPHASAPLLQALTTALSTTTADAAVPVVAGKRGHPAAFRKTAWRRLSACGGKGGPRSLLDELAAERALAEVTWSDWRVLDDINTPDDWAHVYGQPLT